VKTRVQRPLQTHPFAWDWPRSDWRGRALCECGSIEDARVHKLPDTTEPMNEHRRRAGEQE